MRSMLYPLWRHLKNIVSLCREFLSSYTGPEIWAVCTCMRGRLIGYMLMDYINVQYEWVEEQVISCSRFLCPCNPLHQLFPTSVLWEIIHIYLIGIKMISLIFTANDESLFLYLNQCCIVTRKTTDSSSSQIGSQIFFEYKYVLYVPQNSLKQL